MKIKILLNNENYVIGYASVGDLENSIEVTLQNELVDRTSEYKNKWNEEKNSFEITELISFSEEINDKFTNNYKYYKLIDGILVFDENKKIKEELELDISNLEIEIMEKIKEFEIIKNSMFSGTQKEIDAQKELDDLKQKYLDLTHELALQLNKNL